MKGNLHFTDLWWKETGSVPTHPPFASKWVSIYCSVKWLCLCCFKKMNFSGMRTISHCLSFCITDQLNANYPSYLSIRLVLSSKLVLYFAGLQCIVKFIISFIFSSNICIIHITFVWIRLWKCNYILLHLPNMNVNMDLPMRRYQFT